MKKQISFDLDTNVLKQILGERNYTEAYYSIKKFMKENDWKHVEGSIYVSNKQITNPQAQLTVRKLKKKIPYLSKAVREIHITNVSNIYSLSYMFDYDGTPGKYAQTQGKSYNIKPLAKEHNDMSLHRKKTITVPETKVNQKANQEKNKKRENKYER